MILICWNCEGLGTPCTVHTLGELIHSHHPSLVFLTKTKCKKGRIEGIKRRFDLFGCCVESTRRSGGLALLWDKSISVQLQSLGPHHIDVTIYPEVASEAWRFTGFYDFAETSSHQCSWELLSYLKNLSRRDWMVAGDFNEILCDSEKSGGCQRLFWQIRRFREALESTNLHDLGYEGSPFTWCNQNPKPDTIYEHLDRACADPSWRSKFPNAVVRHISVTSSDHVSLLINTTNSPRRPRIKHRPFRFEAGWAAIPECEQVISRGWNSNLHMSRPSLLDRQRSCAAQLQAWSSKDNINSTGERIKKLEKDLIQIRRWPITTASKFEENRICGEIEYLLARKEVFWKQRGKVHWLREGDRNTSFFHNQANFKRRTNLIQRIQNEEGRWLDKEEDIQDHIETYFGNIFPTRNPSEEFERGTEAILVRIYHDMMQELSKPYTVEEISHALSQMAPLKSPEPDGMPLYFFQKYWHVVQEDVIFSTLQFLNHLILPPELNHTHIAVIPKCKNPKTLSQFRPISLCNVAYKIASKTIANRLKPLLDAIIFPCQAAFVPGRLITDNVLLAFEVNHYLNTKTWGKKGHMAVKLDISKAYDKVEWRFLEKVLVRLGFPSHLVRLVMLCVSTVSYSFILCGSQFGSVSPHRGLRQGDPLSPYLFYCARRLFLRYCRKRKGVAVCRQAPKVSHLLFGDDMLIFCQATMEAASSILEMLETFGKASWQEINFAKSSVVFSKNTDSASRNAIQDVLQIRLERRHDLYLRLPSVVDKSRRVVFQSIWDRVWQRISGWNELTFSQAGKKILIKAVAQAIPTYAMGCFRLPTLLIKEIQSMIANYWWHNEDLKKIHWISWSKLSRQKVFGGMGFRDLQAFNLTMLWRILLNPVRVLSRVPRARYFPHGQILVASVGRNPSFTWRSILLSQQIVQAGLRWRVGNGNTIRVWDDPWLLRPFLFRAISPHGPELAHLKVCDLIDADTKDWNNDLIRIIFWQEDANLILDLSLSFQNGDDFFGWHHTANGKFSVRSAYHVAVSLNNMKQPCSSIRSSSFWKLIWNCKIPHKVQVFCWRLAHNALPTGVNLSNRMREEEFVCPLCYDHHEDTEPAFLRCTFVRQARCLSNLRWAAISNFFFDPCVWMERTAKDLNS
ncbi:UNVERIFIED_CONTAM: Retrovirus-related Pol polyprotein from type-1 retrotransposable element R2 [Sesamum latifolium]|uniref:Retrovirus-related Pol polyprotein from type-1 retrotransposable element R2 n=1 Tax=Sesamum latifolium TaxID=2727402 RepID=A0AAW2XD42_9LAMI